MKRKIRKPKSQTSLDTFEAKRNIMEMRKKMAEDARKNLPRKLAIVRNQLERSNLSLGELRHYEARLERQLEDHKRHNMENLVILTEGELGLVREFIRMKQGL
jgi:hypothetical protein